MRLPKAVIFVFIAAVGAFGQGAPDRDARIPSDKANAKLMRWEAALPQLALAARTLSDQNARPEALVAVADAYWELDQGKAQELFLAALDLALAIDPSEKERQSAIRTVIAAAGKHDSKLTKRLIERLESEKDRESRSQAISAALDLLQTDASAAESIALASSRFGPSFDAAWLIFELQKRDPAAANRVYSAYLNNVNPGRPSQLLWLAGYPFGYREAFGGATDPLQFTGVFGLDNTGMTPNPTLANAFLTTTHRVVTQTLQSATDITPDQAQALNGLVYFISMYLSAEFGKYRPDLVNQWRVIQQTAGASLTSSRREEIVNKLNSIVASRSRTSRANAETETDIEDLLARAEKSPTSCGRDMAFATASMQVAHTRDFKRAISITDRIYDLALRDGTLQFIYYDMSAASLAKKSGVDLDESLRNAERLASPEQRGILYLKIAASWRAKGDKDRAYALLLKAAESAEHIAQPAIRAGLLFATAYDLTELDPGLSQAITKMKDAIRLLNNNKDVRIDQISIVRRLDLACDKKGGAWYGSSDNLGRVDLIATLVKMADTDAATAEELAHDLAEGPNRIRALAAIAVSEIRSARGLSKAGDRRR
ncbi:MAG: hypothetical protein WAM70_15365 [Pyrinomonadaceae bacterium]